MNWWTDADWLTVKVLGALFALACLGGIYNHTRETRRLLEQFLRRSR